MRRFLATLLMLGTLAALACAEKPARAASGSNGKRVVSLHDVTTDFVVTLGATGQLVGIAELTDPAPEVLRAVAQVPRVSSLETVLAAAPDLVLAYRVVAEHDPELVQGLERNGIEVRLYDPQGVDEVVRVTRQIAHVLHRDEAGEALAKNLARDLAGFPKLAESPRIFVFDCCDPPFTAGRRALLNELITRAGGQNIFDDLDADWAHVSWEQVLSRRPDLVLVHTYGDNVETKLHLLDAHPALRALPRLQMPLRCALAGPRAPEAVARLRAALVKRAP